MVDLPSMRPEEGAWIALRREGANPTGSLKDRMAPATIDEARERGALEPGGRVVACPDGSTGSRLTFACAVLGHPALHIVPSPAIPA